MLKKVIGLTLLTIGSSFLIIELPEIIHKLEYIYRLLFSKEPIKKFGYHFIIFHLILYLIVYLSFYYGIKFLGIRDKF